MRTEKVRYIHFPNTGSLPVLAVSEPFMMVVIVELVVSNEDRNRISDWIVEAGCRYMMAWGHECSKWDDAVDWSNIERFKFQYIPPEEHVITTWHENSSLLEVFEFAKSSAEHEALELKDTVLLHISESSREAAILEEFSTA